LKGNTESGTNETRIFYQKLLFFCFSPLLILVGSMLFWKIVPLCKEVRYRKEKLITTLLVLLFLAHSSISKYLFDSLK
jgi:hypothetical protein